MGLRNYSPHASTAANVNVYKRTTDPNRKRAYDPRMHGNVKLTSTAYGTGTVCLQMFLPLSFLRLLFQLYRYRFFNERGASP